MPVIEMCGETLVGVPLHSVRVRTETFRNPLFKEEIRDILCGAIFLYCYQ